MATDTHKHPVSAVPGGYLSRLFVGDLVCRGKSTCAVGCIFCLSMVCVLCYEGMGVVMEVKRALF